MRLGGKFNCFSLAPRVIAESDGRITLITYKPNRHLIFLSKEKYKLINFNFINKYMKSEDIL